MIDYRTELMRQAVVPVELPLGKGDGIVTVGEGRYWPMIVAGLKVLRDTGCKLPVEVWGREECNTSELDNVSFHLIRSNMSGWAAKLHAIRYTSFDRILFLDADAYCVNDPAPLFKLLDDCDFIFWKDLPKQVNTINWEKVYPRGRYVKLPPVQGGQMLFDRIKCKTLIHLSHYMSEHAGYFFQHMYGDQDTWRIGLALDTVKPLVLGDAVWKWNLAFECSHDGTPYIIHRCGGKLFEPRYVADKDVRASNPNYGIPHEAELFQYFADYVNRVPHDCYDVFENIRRKRLWGGGSVSGSGSTANGSLAIVDAVNELIREYEVSTLVDAGCGIGDVGNEYRVGSYVGYDVCPQLVRQCAQKFIGNIYHSLDISLDYGRMIEADCLVCKDVLHHWPNSLIKQFLDYLIRSKKYRVVCLINDISQQFDNQDCHLGGFRGLNAVMNPLANYCWNRKTIVGYKELLIMEL